jgi:hypothetical protein
VPQTPIGQGWPAAQQVANVEDEATGTLAFTGTAQEGGSLTADVSGITDADGSFTPTYQWEISTDGVTYTAISAATTPTLSIPDDQTHVGKYVRLTATTTDGFGADELTGGLDQPANQGLADYFVYLHLQDKGDTILDFSQLQKDKLDFSQFEIDLPKNTVVNNVSTTPSSLNTNQFYFNQMTKILSIDTSGDHVADFQITMNGVASLQSSDFIF